MKLFRIGWTNEGIMWRKGYFVIKKPRYKGDTWKVRRVGSKLGKQMLKYEHDFEKEKEAFKHGNKVNKKVINEEGKKAY